MNNTYYVGLDVHKESIAIAYTQQGSREDAVFHGKCGGSNLAAERALRALAKKLRVKLQDFKVCYEAGPTGFVLARHLIRLGLDCVVMAPTKTTRKPNEKIKTDKRDAMKIAMDPEGIQLSRRRITLSTSGVVPEIARTAAEIGCQLAVSFHATTDAVRDRLVPINKRWNISELLDALRSYPKASNSERITFEYVMLNGVNDSDEDARRLIRLIEGIPAKINLIPFNEWPGAPYTRSSNNRIRAFADIIYKAGYATPIRTPRGEDIMAACGQLKSATERARKSRRQIEAETGL